MYNEENYMQMKEFYLSIFKSMEPDENASQEMRDAFDNALEDFWRDGY